MSEMTDTIQCDTGTISLIRSSGEFDYYSQKRPADREESTTYDPFEGMDIRQTEGGRDLSLLILIIFAVVMVSLIVVLLYSKRDKKVEKKKTEDSSDEELTIEGRDFDKELSEAERRGDWNSAVRIVYLRTLNNLCEKGRVVWQADKTPTDYSVEAGIDTFRQMTNHFLRIRYGMFDADREMLDEMLGMGTEVEKGGDDEK